MHWQVRHWGDDSKMTPIRFCIRHVPLLWIIAISTAHADGFDRYRAACQAEQLATVQKAITKANGVLIEVTRALPPNNSLVGKKFQRWFGGPEGSSDPAVEGVFAEALSFLGFKTFWCPNASFPKDRPHRIAFVPQGANPFGEVFVSAAFFDLPTTGANSQAGTVIHEVVHLATRATIKDVVYGTRAAAALADQDPARARRNADNYEYFVEDLVDGIP